MNAPGKRIVWIDIARCIGIVLVVYGHVLRGLIGAHVFSTADAIWASDYTIYTFHMPLFFLLAGLQVDRSMSKGSLLFLKNKLRTIAYPYLLWSIFQGAIQLLLPDVVNTQRSPMTLLTILWRPIAQFWFLYVLFLCHLLAFWVRARRPWLTLLIAGSLACVIPTSFGYSPSWALPIALAYYFLFYATGIFLSKFLLAWEPRPGTAALFTGFAAAAFAAFSHIGRNLSHSRPDALFSWPATAAGIMLTICLSYLIDLRFATMASWMEKVGRASLTIYIFHVLVTAGTRFALKKMHMTSASLQLIFGTSAGIALPFLLHLWLERANLLSLFGLGPKRFTPISNRSHYPVIPVGENKTGRSVY